VTLRRILLLGGSGRLGSAVLRAAGADLEVAMQAPARAELDLEVASQGELDALVGAGLFDAVLNCAAAARVDACEEERDRAQRLNATVPGMLAVAAARADLPFVHVSTDYVFGGPGAESGPFAEGATRGPAQHYGATKADGERAVLATHGRRVVVRVSWLFGPGATPFADHVLAHARAGTPVPVLDQASRPTWLPGMARWLVDLCAVVCAGAFTPDVLHPAGGPTATRADWARAILDAHGLSEVPTVPQVGPSLPAARPRDSRLDATRTDAWIAATWAAALPDWREFVGPEGATAPRRPARPG
jgi:dTDP-4-dehydrorhamnose reductase